jgi:uncharacterized integral membrane protein (TIGR00698 family)
VTGAAGAARRVAPGLLLAAAVAAASLALAQPLGALLRAAGVPPLPAMVLALVLGVSLNGLAARPLFAEGLGFCAKRLLRVAVALLGLRIAAGDVVALGAGTALLVVAAMAGTLALAVWMGRRLGQEAGAGALAGAATAVCGASATLAAAAALPAWRDKGRDVAFTVVAANAASTLAMLAYPAVAAALGLGARDTGVLLGATIHDMAQVVGSAYAVSPEAGDAAVVVKLFRVLLLLPAVLALGWWFAARGRRPATGGAPAPAAVPGFAVGFLLLCALNSVLPVSGAVGAVWAPLRAALVEASSLGLLVAIAALGLGTSVRAILGVGWRHLAVFGAASLALLFFVAGALALG